MFSAFFRGQSSQSVKLSQKQPPKDFILFILFILSVLLALGELCLRMNIKLESLLAQMKEIEFGYEIKNKKVQFTKAVKGRHDLLATKLSKYLRQSRLFRL